MKAIRPGTYRMLDAYRGVASLGVVGFHWGEMSLHRQPELAGYVLYILSGYGFLGVQFFFVISGYCIANAAAANLRRNDTLGKYLLARVRRVYPTYWAALILAGVFYQSSYVLAKQGLIAENLFTKYSLWEHSPLYYLSNMTLTMVPVRQQMLLAVAWTLCYELAFYGLVALALLVCTRQIGRMLTLLHGLTILSLGALILVPTHGVFPLDLWPHFGLGVFLYDLLTLRDDPARRRAVGIGFVAALGLYGVFIARCDVPIGYFGQTSRVTFAAAALFSLFLWATHRFDAKWASVAPLKWLGFIGVFSYSLYLTHTITLRLVNQLWQKLHLPDALHLFAFLLALVVSVAAAYGFFLIFERPFLGSGRKKEAVV